MRRFSFRQSEVREAVAAYVFLLPALILLGVWMLYPLLQTFLMSFQDVNLFNFGRREFIGFANYRELLQDPDFRWSLQTTMTFVLLVVPIQTVLSLVAAVLLNRLGRGKGLLRTAFFVPYVTSTVAVTVVFMRLFTRDGVMARWLSKFGFPNVTWFADMNLALPFLAIVYVWMNFGFYIVLFLTGLSTIPPELYDAAAVDGASGLRAFWHVTIPMLRPFVFLVLTTGIIYAFQVFDQAYVLSRGGTLGSPAGATMTLVVFVYAQAFRYNRFGYGSAASVVLLLIVLAVTVLLRTGFRDETS